MDAEVALVLQEVFEIGFGSRMRLEAEDMGDGAKRIEFYVVSPTGPRVVGAGEEIVYGKRPVFFHLKWVVIGRVTRGKGPRRGH